MPRGFNNDSLRDLDLELELLKRKRQVLQEKRQIMEEQRQFNLVNLPFQQSSYAANVGFGNSSNFQNYSNRGGKRGGGRGNTFSGMNFGTKRSAPTDSSWNPPEKRFAGSFRGGGAKKAKQAYVPKPFVEKPIPRSDKPSKGEVSMPAKKKVDHSLTLRSNVPISNQLMGRLELLLGTLLKQLKSICQAPPINKTIFSIEALASVKKEIRARIQKALLNKQVSGNATFNLAHYRKMYPIDTDRALIELMLADAAQPIVDKTELQEKVAEPDKHSNAELFKNYLKQQFDTALKIKLSEMLDKLKKIYDEEEKNPDEDGKTQSDPKEVTESEVAVAKNTLSPEEIEFEGKVESLIRKKLYTLLPEYKHFLKNILKTPQLINDIVNQYEKGEPIFVHDDKESPSGDNKTKPELTDTQTPTYVARVVGHPYLPPRDVMKEFLNKFEPVSIKKYSWAHNVLYVELPNEACFEAVMASNGTFIDDTKIIVKRQNMQNYKKKRPNVKTDSNETTSANGEANTVESDGEKPQENTNDNGTQGKADSDVMKEDAGNNEENSSIEKSDSGKSDNNTETTSENVTQISEEKETSANTVNDDPTGADIDLDDMGVDLDKPSSVKKEPDVYEDSAIFHIDLGIQEQSDGKQDDHKSLKCDQEKEMEGDKIAIEDVNNLGVTNDNVKDEVTNETVINNEVVDVADEGWNTDVKDEWADLKERDLNDEKKDDPSTSVRVTRSSRRLTSENKPVAGVLMSYSRGCDAVLGLMAEGAPRTPPDACSDGYHSDSDHGPPTPPHAQPPDERSKLVSRYAALYTRAAEEALPALAALEPLQHSPQLKYKIVFSVVVLSFRAVIGLKERRLGDIRTLLGIDAQTENAPAVTRLSAAAVRVLQDTAHAYPLGDAERTVVNQVLSTLREYPCLGSCAALHSLVSSACRVAWLLSVHTPPLRIDTDFTPVVLNPERHVRYSRGSEQQKRSDLIRSFVWPALLDGDSCVFRAVVIT